MFPSFGSDEFFSFLSNNISNPNYGEYYDLVAQVVKRDSEKKIYGSGLNKTFRLSYHDVEEIIQEVQLSVFKSLVRFCRTSWNLAPQQRQEWLSVMVERRVFDYCDNAYGRNRFNTDSIDDPEAGIDLPDMQGEKRSVEDKILFNDCMETAESTHEALQFILSINTTPDKIIACILNKLSCINHDSKIKNGEPQKISALLYGMTAKNAAEIIIRKLSLMSKLVQCEASFANTVNSMNNMLSKTNDGIRNAEFKIYITAEVITKSTYWITKKLNEYWKSKKRIFRAGFDTPTAQL